MPIFEYEAQDSTGSIRRGTLIKSDVRLAEAALTAQGLNNIRIMAPSDGMSISATQTQKTQSINPQPDGTVVEQQDADKSLSTIFNRVRLHKQAFLFHQLAAIFDAGVNPVLALTELKGRIGDRVLRDVISVLQNKAERGEDLYGGFQQYPGAFSPYVMSMIRAGEKGGFLPRAFEYIASDLDNEVALRRRLRVATFYPKLLAGFAVVVVYFINDISKSIIGRDIYSSPVFEPKFWIVAGPILAVGFLVQRYLFRAPAIKAMVDHVVIYIPFFGSLARQFAMAKFGRAFGSLYRAGVLPSDALVDAARSCGNNSVERQMMRAVEPIRTGASITHSLSATGAFPNLVIQMVHTGETTGRLDEMLLKMADYYDKESGVRANQAAIAAGITLLVVVVLWIASMALGALGGVATGIKEVTSGLE